MRFIYLSILAITLSFTMNTYAENPKVNMYVMDVTEETEDYFGANFDIICAEGLMFISAGYGDGRALVQMMSSGNHPKYCPIKKIEE